MNQAGITFDQVLCSDAKRARETLSLLKQGMDIDEGNIEYRSDMYCASAEHLLSCTLEQPDSLYNIALLGHNPGMEDLADRLAKVSVGSMPTCCVIQLVYECNSWNDLLQEKGDVSVTIYPRDL